MEHAVALNFEDGVTRFIATRPGETVADASYRLGINIPLDCRDGACGTCKCRVESGEYDGGSYIEDALTDAEAAAGLGLACQMRPRSDLVLGIAASAAACKTRAAAHAAELVAVEVLSDTTFALTVRPAAPLAFLPGQYVNVGVPGSARARSYSFSTAPGADLAGFLVRNIPGGAMSGFLAGMPAPGTPLSLTGPIGGFYLREPRRPVVMLAGGTGLAPFLSMLDRMAATGCDQPAHLVYGVTRDADLVALDRIEAAAARLPRLTWTTCVADPASAHPRLGYVTAHLDPERLHGGAADVYLCGPPPMVEAVRAHLAASGVAPAGFHHEKFAPSGAA